MSTTLLPDVVRRASALVIFALAAFLVAAHATLSALAAGRSGASPRARALAPWLVGGYLAVWLGLGLTVGADPGFARWDRDLRLAISLAVGFGPVLVAAALLASSRTVRALNAATPPEWLIRIQSYRMLGLIFLFPFLAYGVVPAAFALPAALGDFATGLAAPFVASAVARRRPGARAWAIAWNLFGLADLVVAPAAAVLTGASVLAIYPLVLVPLFAGPPLGILTHVWSLRNLAATRRDEARRTAPLPDAVGAT